MDGYDWTIYTTWQLSFERLRTHSVQAATFLQYCVFLHHDGISQAIFQNAAVDIESPSPIRSQILLTMPKTSLLCFRRQGSGTLGSSRRSSARFDRIRLLTLMIKRKCTSSMLLSMTGYVSRCPMATPYSVYLACGSTGSLGWMTILSDGHFCPTLTWHFRVTHWLQDLILLRG